MLVKLAQFFWMIYLFSPSPTASFVVFTLADLMSQGLMVKLKIVIDGGCCLEIIIEKSQSLINLNH